MQNIRALSKSEAQTVKDDNFTELLEGNLPQLVYTHKILPTKKANKT